VVGMAVIIIKLNTITSLAIANFGMVAQPKKKKMVEAGWWSWRKKMSLLTLHIWLVQWSLVGMMGRHKLHLLMLLIWLYSE